MVNTVQDNPNYSIQISNYRNVYNERSPLLSEDGGTCIRRAWIGFFLALLLAGLFIGTYLLCTETADSPISESYYFSVTSVERLKGASTEQSIATTYKCPNDTRCREKEGDAQKRSVRDLKESDNVLLDGDGHEGRDWSYELETGNEAFALAFVGVFNKTTSGQTNSILENGKNHGNLTWDYVFGDRNNTSPNDNKTRSVINSLKSYLIGYLYR